MVLADLTVQGVLKSRTGERKTASLGYNATCLPLGMERNLPKQYRKVLSDFGLHPGYEDKLGK